MSLSVAGPELDREPRVRAGAPVVPRWTLPRAGLNELLDAGITGVVTVVSAPTGAGKSLGVASWAAGPTSPPGLVWLNLARGGAEPDRVWRLLRRALHEAGEPHLPPGPTGPASAAARVRALVELGESLRDRGPWTVVLDGYPTGTPARLGSELEIVLDHAGRALRLVMLCQGEPALDLHRFWAAGELMRVRDADLVMDDDEIRGVLRLTNGASDEPAVTAVSDHTSGWACGVRRAAVALGTSTDVASAMEETDRAIEDYLAHEVLAAMTAPIRRLLVWTSVVEVAPPGVVRAVLGPNARSAIDRTIHSTGLVQRFPDGSLTCHPLLRAAARRQLTTEHHPPESRATHERIARWFADHGEPEAAVELCVAAHDWEQVASILIQAHAIPRMVAGNASQAVRCAGSLPEVQAAEPLVRTAVALARGDLLAAEVALEDRMSMRARSQPADLIAAAFLHLGIARLAGRPVADPGLVPRTRGLLAQASVADPDGLVDLAVALDAFAGALDVSAGHLQRAAAGLTRGADHPNIGRSHLASANCAGQLALLEAHRGNLRQATRWADTALAIHHERAGAEQALLALAWAHVDRGELPEARDRLDRAEGFAVRGTREPWLVLVRELVEARLLVASGRPDEAMRLAASRTGLHERVTSTWFAGLETEVAAEAMLAAGEPQQALALVTSGLSVSSVERAVLTAVARRDIGDMRGAGAAIASAAHNLPGAPRGIQLRGWVLEARLAHERGQVDRAIQLVERALRAASAEELRRPLAGDGPWLRWFLDRDGAALRNHRPFVLSLLSQDHDSPRVRQLSLAPAEVRLEPLTERETQVLELLAQMCSTDEIAAELFVSANTVKTHLKGIFRKYGVNRRVDAVRRGRELGLC